MSEEEIVEVEAEGEMENGVESRQEGKKEDDASPDADLRARVTAIVEAALERNAHDPVALDISELTSYASVLIVMHGNSDRQVRSIAEHIIKDLKARDDHPLGVEGMSEGRWVLVDANDIIVHIFDHDSRHLFNLEALWGDAPRITLDITTPTSPAAPGLGSGGESGGESGEDPR